MDRISGEVTSPTLLYKVEPDYSEKAKRAKIQGVVMLAMEDWEDGRAHNIRVVKSPGYGLDEKAIEAVWQWRFKPGTKDGKPVRVAVQVHVGFRPAARRGGETAGTCRSNPLERNGTLSSMPGPVCYTLACSRARSPPRPSGLQYWRSQLSLGFGSPTLAA